jgi:hypothetical protein
MEPIKIERMPRIVLCELCKHGKTGRCTSRRGDASFAVLSGRCDSFNSLISKDAYDKINILLNIEGYLSKCDVVELTDKGFKVRNHEIHSAYFVP